MKSSKKKRLNVLLLDDERQILNLNELVLGHDFNIFKAANIGEALECISSHEIHIIISDHFIGSENGLKFLLELHKEIPAIIKIIFSSCTSHEVIIQSHNSQAIFRYLTKPCSNDDLLENTKLAALTWEITCYEKLIKAEHSTLKESFNSVDLIELRSQKKIHSLKLVSSHLTKIIIYIGLGTLLTGTLALLVLYSLKSLLGFDIFK